MLLLQLVRSDVKSIRTVHMETCYMSHRRCIFYYRLFKWSTSKSTNYLN